MRADQACGTGGAARADGGVEGFTREYGACKLRNEPGQPAKRGICRMPNDKPERPSDKPGETDSLSATGMFLRAFGENPKADAAPSDPLFGSPAAKPPQAPGERPSQQSGPGEFTQMFQNLEAKPVAPAMPAAEPPNLHSTATFRPSSPSMAEPATPAAPQSSSGLSSGSGSGPSEFTRVFVGGANQSPAQAPRVSEDFAKPGSAPAAGGTRVYSSPGVSGSASGEGSFTQIFSTSPARPSASPSEPPVPSSPRNPEWNNDPYFRSPSNPAPPESSPSVTSLLSSLGTPGGSAVPGRPAEPVPYRPEPSARSAPLFSQEAPGAEAGGVTRLIQRLAQAPAEPQGPAPAAPVAPPLNSGPGEFTRIISRMSAPPAAEPPIPAPQAATPPPPAFAMPHAPAMPAVALPAMPHAAPPAAPAMPMPPAPKLPAFAAPAIAPPKSKLEAMVPILLVINTFLLLILLIVVIFLIKSK